MGNYVLVTGASSGIGRATAVRLSNTYPLILGGRDEMRLKETRAMCGNARNHLLWCYNLADVEGIAENLVTFLKEKSVSVGSFVHFAGIAPLAPLRMTTTETMRKIMDVNFFSAVEIVKLLSNKKINGKSLTCIVLISSIQSRIGAKGQSIYCASKAAIEGFMRAMAVELAPSVRLNVIRPGAIQTPMGDLLEQNQELLAKSSDDGYLLGLGEAEDIATMTEYLLGECAKWITGQIFTVDGGRCAH